MENSETNFHISLLKTSMKKKFFFTFIFINSIFISVNNKIIAQTHSNFWSRLSLNKKISSRYKFDLELQYRRQNGFENNNPVFEPLLYSLRTWVVYQPKKEIQFSISPFAYFYHFPIINNASDVSKPFLKEYRIAFAMDNKIANYKKYVFQNRVGLEYRIFQPTINNVVRFREKLAMKYAFTSKWSLFVYDEMLLNLCGVARNHMFDHNRLGWNVNFNITPKYKIEAGYIFITRLQRTAITNVEENNFLLNFTYFFTN
jgi:hypothetical protein